MAERVEKLIAETEEWRKYHVERRAMVEALACSIRLKALRDAVRALKDADHG